MKLYELVLLKIRIDPNNIKEITEFLIEEMEASNDK